jgi:exodeoxyribonuclease VII large subunit
MARPAKTQWDFGDLFEREEQKVHEPAPPQPVTPQPEVRPEKTPKTTRKIFSVSELTSQIRRLLEGQFGQIWVTGEITNFRSQTSGHVYFTLKDVGAQLSCVLFRGELLANRSLLQDGRKVTLGGEITVYDVRGQHQLRVTSVELEGVGALQIAFEKLKQKLQAEGLFAKERKRPLPRYPRRIGLVTSPTGAAIRDVLHVIERRNPSLEVILASCRVQGDGAGMEVAAAIRLLNEFHRSSKPGSGLDLILVTRGGGSLEDLWAFNEEVVGRAIFNSALPVVSAVGHEVDFTISDFVADLRAATPSAAAEIITEGVFSSCQFVAQAAARIRQLVRQRVADKRYILEQTNRHLARMHPRRKFNDRLQRLDDLRSTLIRCAKQGTRDRRTTSRGLIDRLSRVRPAVLLKQRREALQQRTTRLRERARQRLERLQHQIGALEGRLRLLGPEQVLARGYSITTDAQTGKIVMDAAGLKKGQLLKIRFKKGSATTHLDEVSR